MSAEPKNVAADVRRLTKDQTLVTSAATKSWTRRGFFRDGARYGLLAAIGGVIAHVTTRKLSPESQKCSNLGICRACGKFSGCGLPEALSVRSVLQEGKT